MRRILKPCGRGNLTSVQLERHPVRHSWRWHWLVPIWLVMQVISGCARADSPNRENMVYFGTYTGKSSRGIYVARFDPRTGSLSTPELAAETRNPTFLVMRPDGLRLYAANEVGD